MLRTYYCISVCPAQLPKTSREITSNETRHTTKSIVVFSDEDDSDRRLFTEIITSHAINDPIDCERKTQSKSKQRFAGVGRWPATG